MDSTAHDEVAVINVSKKQMNPEVEVIVLSYLCIISVRKQLETEVAKTEMISKNNESVGLL